MCNFVILKKKDPWKTNPFSLANALFIIVFRVLAVLTETANW